MPVAQISALKPGGSLKFCSGISLAGVAVSLPATGASVELAWSGVRPCCQAGAAAAGAAAVAAGGVDWQAASSDRVAAASRVVCRRVRVVIGLSPVVSSPASRLERGGS